MTVMLLQNNVCVYNNNNNNVSKSGPSTIEDQYRQQFNKNGGNLNESRPRLNVFSLQHSGEYIRKVVREKVTREQVLMTVDT